jgi:uridine nucleosidase
MLSTLIIFFSETYKSTFGFNDGPPLHDALTIAYVAHPEMFTCRRYRVDVELQGLHTSGETVVDVWGYRSCDDTWGVGGKNCIVAEAVDVSTCFTLPFRCNTHGHREQVEAFFDFVLQCISRCDKYSPLNV